jgi:integrase
MLVSTYLQNYLERQAYRPSTSRNYQKHIKQLGLMDLEINQITPKLIMESCARLQTYTVRRSALISCRAIFKEHLGLDHKKIPILPHVQKVYEFPTQDELHEMIGRTKYRLQLLLCMYAGLRVGEACAIRKQDLIGNRLTITRQVGQDGSVTTAKTIGVVVIPNWLADEINESVGDLFQQGKGSLVVTHACRNQSDRTGKQMNPHLLRHWYCTTLINNGANPEIVRRQMRHANLNTTMRTYVQVKPSQIMDSLPLAPEGLIKHRSKSIEDCLLDDPCSVMV